MDIRRWNLPSTEGFDCPGVDLHICPSNGIQHGAGVVRGMDLGCVAMAGADTQEIQLRVICCNENCKDILFPVLAWSFTTKED